MAKQGYLVAFEGIDGSGKSTLAKGLYEHFFREQEVVLTKEPSSGVIGAYVRQVIQNPESKLNSLAEYLLFAADRAHHHATVIMPALQAGKLVLCDRMGDSSVAYQGYGRGLDIEHIKIMNRWATGGMVPDLTIYVKLDYATACERIAARCREKNEKPSRFDQQKADFFERVTSGYEALYRGRTDVLVIDGKRSAHDMLETVAQELATRVRSR